MTDATDPQTIYAVSQGSYSDRTLRDDPDHRGQPPLCVFVTGSSVIVSYPTPTLPRKYVSTPREDRHFPPSGMRNVSEWPRRERNLP